MNIVIFVAPKSYVKMPSHKTKNSQIIVNDNTRNFILIQLWSWNDKSRNTHLFLNNSCLRLFIVVIQMRHLQRFTFIPSENSVKSTFSLYKLNQFSFPKYFTSDWSFLVKGQTMFNVRLFKAKNRVFKFDYQSINLYGVWSMFEKWCLSLFDFQ